MNPKSVNVSMHVFGNVILKAIVSARSHPSALGTRTSCTSISVASSASHETSHHLSTTPQDLTEHAPIVGLNPAACDVRVKDPWPGQP